MASWNQGVRIREEARALMPYAAAYAFWLMACGFLLRRRRGAGNLILRRWRSSPDHSRRRN